MRKSTAIKLALLGGGAFAFSCCLCGGCGNDDDGYDPGPDQVATSTDDDPNWYDAAGNRIEEEYTFNDNGQLVPVGEPHDRLGRPLKFDDNGNRLPLGPVMVAAATGAATGSTYSSGYRRHSTIFWPFWSSRYSSGPSRSYSPSRPSGGSTYFGGSRPGSSPAPKAGGSTSGGSVSRGGFGSGGSSSAS